ncbi:hypothetical protein CHARACLAT_013626 [Characodon lateralis]|uniref:Importin subunit beta-1/Transportin-1-like TPR repeats domain-containing protein n=1 Tax=Characodon lateralis TaxID=208331 RepID=A0ABU7F401_9TELE|nr:hypothetical protein [Characodon lateralis]
MLTCFSSTADVMLVQPRVEFILSFIHHIAEDEDHSDGVVANAAGLIGDLCTAFDQDAGHLGHEGAAQAQEPSLIAAVRTQSDVRSVNRLE